MKVIVCSITESATVKAYLTSVGRPYTKGCVYYNLNKKELIQDAKTILVRRKSDGIIVGGPAVRVLLGISDSTAEFNLDTATLTDFDVFVQSTSPVRKLMAGTDALYVVADTAAEGVVVFDSALVAAEPDIPTPAAVPSAPTGRGRARRAVGTSGSAVAAAPEAVAAATAPTASPSALPTAGPNAVEVVITFDTTGSMYPCLTQVRRNVREMIADLFRSIPGIRIGVIAHGDYGDTYVTKHTDLSVNQDMLCRFVETVEATCGFDYEECYELVLREAHTKVSWSGVAKKAVIMIGDALPHAALSPRNAAHIDWRAEAAELVRKGITVYSVQALGNALAGSTFWKPLAHETNGVHLDLDQFSQAKDFIKAICYHNAGGAQLQGFRDQVVSEGRLNRSLHTMFSRLLGESGGFAGGDGVAHTPVQSSRFQVLSVGGEKTSIKDFALANGLTFKVGRGFYEFTKPEVITDKKEVVLMSRRTGDMYTGPEACRLIGAGGTERVRPAALEQWRVFVQSTSANRVLMPNTGFLYEVSEA